MLGLLSAFNLYDQDRDVSSNGKQEQSLLGVFLSVERPLLNFNRTKNAEKKCGTDRTYSWRGMNFVQN